MKYFQLQTKALRRLGISINEYESTVYKTYSAFMICVVYITFPVLSFLELFKTDCADTFSILMLFLTATLAASVQAVILVVNRNKFGKVLSRLEEKPFLPDRNRGGEEEEKLIRECVWITNTQTYLYCGGAMATVMIISLYGLVAQIRDSNHREFPFGPLTPLNIANRLNYEICWIYQVCSMSIFGIATSFMDALIVAVLVHVRYQFKILQNFLEQIAYVSNKLKIKDRDLDDFEGDVGTSTISWEDLQQSLKEAVSYHEGILDIAQEIEIVFSGFMLIVFLESIVVGCLVIYRIPLAMNDARILEYLGLLFCVIGHVILYCYWGEQVTEESLKVGFAAYDTYRPGTDLRFHKALVIIIRRSQRPTVITVAGFAAIGLPTFATILRFTYSAVMLIFQTAGAK